MSKPIEKAKKKLLIEKMRGYSGANAMHPFIRDYYGELSKKFNRVIIRFMERANNGFNHLLLEEKLQRVNKIKSTIDRLARVNNPNNLHIGVAKELAEDTFYKIMSVYSPILEKEYSLV